MTRGRVIIIQVVCLVGFSSAALAQQRFPPPEFDTDYTMPETTVPAPGATWSAYVDLGVLVVAVALASWLAIRARSRRGLLALAIVSLAYFGFYRGGCICPVGAVQNVVLAICDSGYALPLAILGFFLVPLLAAIFFGRTFCAAVCPLGAVQELIVVKPIALPAWLEHALGLLAYVYLAGVVIFAATGSAFILCQYDPFVAIFRLIPIGKIAEGAARNDPLLNAAALSGRIDTLLMAAGFVSIGLFIARPYCRFFCPYGVLLALLSKVSRRCVTITPSQCVRCRLCEDACPVGAIRKPTAQAGSRDRTRGKFALAAALVVLPVLVVAGGALGGLLGGGMARAHPTVQLADRIRLEDEGKVEGTTDASDAFRARGRPAKDLFAEAGEIEAQFVSKWSRGVSFGLAHLFGAFIGLVIGLKLIGLSIRRQRVDYEADRAACVACGRCFGHCPVHRAWRDGTEVVVLDRKK